MTQDRKVTANRTHKSSPRTPAVCDLLQWRAGSAGTGDHAAFQSLYGERRVAKTGTGSSHAQYPSGA